MTSSPMMMSRDFWPPAWRRSPGEAAVLPCGAQPYKYLFMPFKLAMHAVDASPHRPNARRHLLMGREPPSIPADRAEAGPPAEAQAPPIGMLTVDASMPRRQPHRRDAAMPTRGRAMAPARSPDDACPRRHADAQISTTIVRGFTDLLAPSSRTAYKSRIYFAFDSMMRYNASASI